MGEVAGVCHRILGGAICEGIIGAVNKVPGHDIERVGKWAPSWTHPPANVQRRLADCKLSRLCCAGEVWPRRCEWWACAMMR